MNKKHFQLFALLGMSFFVGRLYQRGKDMDRFAEMIDELVAELT